MKLLTMARDLQRRRGRERQGRFVAEGVRTVEALLASTLTVDGLLVADSAIGAARTAALVTQAEARGIVVQMVTEGEFESAADTEQPQGVLAVARIPEWPMPSTPRLGFRALILDALQDPGNVGTVIRTAAALGVDATFALPGTVDHWNAKVVRSSMGALFHHPVHALDWEALASWRAAYDVPCWGADMHGDRLDAVGAPLPERLALIVSNEGAGLSPVAEALVSRRLAIPMVTSVESLNVAVATGILLYALRSAP